MRLGSTLAVSAPSYQVAGAGRALFAGSMTEDDMSLVGTGRATMLAALAGQITYVSLHTADPGDSGMSEVSGGSYARVAASWGTATATSVTLASTTWTIPAGTPTHVGFWTALSGGTFVGSARLANPSARSAGSFTVPSTVVYLDAGDILVSQGALDDFRLVLHNAGLLQAPLRLDPDCALIVDPTGFYDAEQRAVLNSSLITSRTALAVGLGSAGCAGPILGTDKLGAVAWFGQTLAAAYVSCTVPALTSASTFTIEGTYGGPVSPAADVLLASFSGGAYVQFESSGEITFFDGSAADTSASTVATLLSISDDWAEFEWRAVPAGTSLNIDVRLPDGSWVAAVSGATIAAVSPAGQTLYCGSSSTTKGLRAKVRRLTVRDGGTGASKVAEFTPGLFVGGNRADGDTAVDAHGVTWTLARPAATTDMPRVMVGRSEQYISLPGVAGEYVSTPDTPANSITGDIAVAACITLPDLAPASLGTIGAKYHFTGNQRAWRLMVNTTGVLRWRWSADGIASTPIDSPALSEITSAGSRIEVAVYHDVDNGAGGNTIYWYYRAAGATTWILWDSSTQAGATSIFDSTQTVEVGSNASGQNPLEVDVEWLELYDGDLTTGTLVERIDAAEANANATTWTSSTSGATVTVNKSASAQYHATVVPAGTTIVQGDGVNDFAQVVGDDTITDFVPATGLTLVLDASFSSGAGSGGVFASSANATTDDGLIVSRNSTNPRVQGRLDDGTTIATVGDNANNVTYSDRFQATFAFGSSDHEAFVDGVSVETATNAVTAETAAGALRFGAEINGSNPAAFDLYGAAVVKRRLTDTSPPSEVQTIHTEGISA